MVLFALPSAFALDADTYRPAGSATDLQGGLQVQSPEIGWAGSGYASLGLVYAHNPIIQVFEDGARVAVLSDSFATRLGVGYNVGAQVRLDLDLPIYPYLGASNTDRSGFSIGDLRLGALFPVVTREDAPVGVAILPMLNLPTGDAYKRTGSGFGAGLVLAAGVTPSEKVFIDANLGAVASPAAALGEFAFGSNLLAGLGLGYRVNKSVTIGAEIDSQVALAGGVGPYNKNPVELHAYGTYGSGRGLVATLGLGTGLVAGVGAPDVRVLAQVGYRVPGRAPIYDIDDDGIVDPDDTCVDVPEDADGFEDSDGCPDLDNDRDSVADAADRCPDVPEDRDGFEDTDGCPEVDNDKDGLVDTHDVCPSEPGPERTQGCPDRDADQVPDNRDECPDEPKDPREDPERSDGCPKRVFVSLDRIEILDKIYFDTNKATIKEASFPLLQDIANALNGNADLVRIEVSGHTDSDGRDEQNLTLSQGRAEAVARWLTSEGKVDPVRLFGVGYGETAPIDTNSTSMGKANNRRVEFLIRAVRPQDGARPEADATVPTASPEAPE